MQPIFWLVQITICIMMPAIAELMFRAGFRRHSTDWLEREVSSVQAATLGLLALLLGFTLAMAESRFVRRHEIAVAEANAIGTSYLRAGYLDPPLRDAYRTTLRAYVHNRIEHDRAEGNLAEMERDDAQAQRLRGALWQVTETAVIAHPDRVSVAQFMASVNDLIDLDEERSSARENTVPRTIVILLIIVAVVSTGVTGFTCGVIGRRNVLSNGVVPVLIAVSVCIVIDLNRPRLGLISLRNRGLERTLATMQ